MILQRVFSSVMHWRSTNNAIKLSVHAQKSSFVDQFLITNANSRKSSENLCTGEKGFGFRGFSFHHVIPGFMCHNSTDDKSIYGNKCQDENFAQKHSGPSILSIDNTGPNPNGSQFFLCTTETSLLDGKHVVSGNVVQGMEDVWRIKSFGLQFGSTTKKIIVADIYQTLFGGKDEGLIDFGVVKVMGLDVKKKAGMLNNDILAFYRAREGMLKAKLLLDEVEGHASSSKQDQEERKRKNQRKILAIAPVVAIASGSMEDENSNENTDDPNANDASMEVDETVVLDSDCEEDDRSAHSSKRFKSGIETDHIAPVWKFATKVGDSTAKCNICRKTYQIPQGSTSNIRDHILLKHKTTKEGKELQETTDKKREETKKKKEKKEKIRSQQSIETFFPSDRQVSTSSKVKIDDSVVEFFITGNEAFSQVENHFFKKMCFKMNPGFILPSRRELGRQIDTKIDKIKDDLAKEIQDDIKSHKSIHITSDGGNSGDQNKTKKNTITVTRITDQWEMKTDTVAIPEAVGSQTGIVLRRQWKEELDKIGYDKSWKVSATTDAAKNERSARSTVRHEEIGLEIKFEADCVDHQIQLMAKDSRKNILGLQTSLKKGRKLINHFSKSTLSRQLLVTIQKELKLPVKWILVGTKNRWFHEMAEAERLVELRLSIEEFQHRRHTGDGRRIRDEDEDDDDLIVPEQLCDEDFEWLELYVKVMKPFTVMSTFLGGEKYPTAGSVIPALEQIKADITKLRESEKGEDAQELLDSMLLNMEKRFKDNWRNKVPFNCLTFLDPRYLDLYCLEDGEFEKICQNIVYDSVFTEEAANHTVPEPQTSSPSIQPSDRRTELLKQKLAKTTCHQQDLGTFEAKVEAEIKSSKEVTPVDTSENPLTWWKSHENSYPLLAKFVKANAGFQATSVASERIFNVDKLVYDDRRKSIDVERGTGLLVAQDYLKRRMNSREYELCSECPGPQSQNQSKYRISCKSHNSK